MSNVVQTKAPQFVDLGLPVINTFNEISVIGTSATRIQSPTDVSHWTAPDHVFSEAAAVGMSAEKSDHEYSYKTDFEIWRENQDFERQNILMSQPPLDSTPIVTNTKNVTTSHLDWITIEKKRQTISY